MKTTFIPEKLFELREIFDINLAEVDSDLKQFQQTAKE